MTKLIIQIPCLNEEQTLPGVLADLPQTITGVEQIEVLVVDDGSTDATSQVARQWGVDHVLRHRQNKGLSTSFSDGLMAAIHLGADIIVNTDGDQQYPGHDIPRLIAPIVEGRADLVIGDRRPHLLPSNPWTKRLLYRIGRRVVSWLARRDLKDPVCGFRAISKDAALRMHLVTAYSYTIESLVQACQKGMAIDHIAIDPNPATRPSRLMTSIPSFVLRSTSTLLRAVLMYRCLQFMIILSCLLGGLGLLPVIRFLMFYLVGDGDGHLQSLVLGCSLLVLSGLVLLAGLISDLISHNRLMLEQVLENHGRRTPPPFGDLWSKGPAEDVEDKAATPPL